MFHGDILLISYCKYIKNKEGKCNLVQMLIFIWWNSADCNVNQWDLYNSTADTDIKWSKYQSSLYLQQYVLVRWDWNDPNI